MFVFISLWNRTLDTQRTLGLNYVPYTGHIET